MFTAESAPAWVQAIGSIIAILVAIALPAWQRWASRRDAKEDQEQREIEYSKRLVVALRAEIEFAVEAAGRQYSVAKDTLAAVNKSQQMGAGVIDRGPLSMNMLVSFEAS